LYLVGGLLRDKLLGRQKQDPDFDFCLSHSAISLGRQLSRKLKAGFVVLDKEHGACRLVKRFEGKTYTFDFTDFRGSTLKEDLRKRDFTVNTLALGLEDVFSLKDPQGALVDFYGAREDLKHKVIRIADKSSFPDDPLRIMRAFSYASILGFSIDRDTIKQAASHRAKLGAVSSERVRDELFKIFLRPDSYEYIVVLDKLKILEVIFPQIKKMRGIGQGPYHHLDVWQHTLETLKQLEILFAKNKNGEVKEYLDEIISADRTRRSILKLGAILHDIGKPKALRHEEGKTTFHAHERIGLNITREITRRLRMSNDEINALHKIVLWHLRPGYLGDNDIVTARAKFRYFRDTSSEAVSVLLLSVADQRATKGPLTTLASRSRHEKVCFGLIREYFRRKKEKKALRLINGHDLIRVFRLKPSPLIGKILSEVEEMQAIGRLKTKEEALKLASKIIKG